MYADLYMNIVYLIILVSDSSLVSDTSGAAAVRETCTIFDELEQEEMLKMMSMPPSNAFEEMIRWTREGKLWHFPIDNDQGLKQFKFTLL